MVGQSNLWTSFVFGLIAFGSSLNQIGPFLLRTVKENAQLLGVIAGNDKKTLLLLSRAVPDFTSKIGQEIKGLKIALPKRPWSDPTM